MPDTRPMQVQNVNVDRVVPLVSPKALDELMPASAQAHATVLDGREAIKRILAGQDPRLLVIVGPCSIHDEKAAIEYAQKLAALRERFGDRLELVMRVYFEKPRTTVGWKGLINDPRLDGSFDIQEGLKIARRLLIHIAEMGLPTGTEMLDPITPQYIDDLCCWAAIGARTTESQTHRQMASGLSMPVGFKNSTEGSVQVALDAMQSAKNKHWFLGIDADGNAAVIQTKGNPWGHVILRGGRERSNFEAEDVKATAKLLADAGLPTGMMVDCSHANSSKKHEQQQVAWKSVIDQRVAGNADLAGLMLESNLVEGSQKLGDDPSSLKYGVSITDACIGWPQTEQLIAWAHQRMGQMVR